VNGKYVKEERTPESDQLFQKKRWPTLEEDARGEAESAVSLLDSKPIVASFYVLAWFCTYVFWIALLEWFVARKTAQLSGLPARLPYLTVVRSSSCGQLTPHLSRKGVMQEQCLVFLVNMDKSRIYVRKIYPSYASAFSNNSWKYLSRYMQVLCHVDLGRRSTSVTPFEYSLSTWRLFRLLQVLPLQSTVQPIAPSLSWGCAGGEYPATVDFVNSIHT